MNATKYPEIRWILFVLTLSLVACNGEVRSRLLTPAQLQAELSRPEGIRGVFGYYDKSVVETDDLTQLVDASGKPVSGPCTPARVKKVVTYTDQDHPIQIWYDYGLLESNQFSVQLNSSVFTAINSQSTPDQGKTLANLASAASSFAKIGGHLLPDQRQLGDQAVTRDHP
jgi:hypothetical protein